MESLSTQPQGPQQVYTVADQVMALRKDALKNSPLGKLPNDVLALIFTNLGATDINAMKMVCRQFKQIGNDPSVMRVVARQLNINLHGNENAEDLKKIFDLRENFRNCLKECIVVNLDKETIKMIPEKCDELLPKLKELVAKAKENLPRHPYIAQLENQIATMEVNRRIKHDSKDYFTNMLYPLALEKFPPGSFVLGNTFDGPHFLCFKDSDSKIYYKDIYGHDDDAVKGVQFHFGHLLKNRVCIGDDTNIRSISFRLVKQFYDKKEELPENFGKLAWAIPIKWEELTSDERRPIVQSVLRKFKHIAKHNNTEREFTFPRTNPEHLYHVQIEDSRVIITQKPKKPEIPGERMLLEPNKGVYRITLEGDEAKPFIDHWKSTLDTPKRKRKV